MFHLESETEITKKIMDVDITVQGLVRLSSTSADAKTAQTMIPQIPV